MRNIQSATNRVIITLIFSLAVSSGIIAQVNLIPNTEDCSSTRAPFGFSITRQWVSNTGNDINCNTAPLSADIDNDGNVEVFALGRNGIGPDSYCIYVFDGATGAEVGKIAPGGIISGYIWTGTNFLICDVDKNGRGEVFLVTPSGRAYLYEVNAGGRPLTFTEKWGGKAVPANNASPVVADLDGDGEVEFVVGSYVLDHNGDMIGTMDYKGLTTGWGHVEFPLVADVDKDGKAEVIVGTNVYKYNGTTLSLWRTCPTLTPQEGSNMVADVDQDGNVDVVFHAYNGTVTVWTPALNTTLGTVATFSGQRSYPFVGDIDGVVTNGKKYPEICINTDAYTAPNTRGTLYAFTYNGTSFSQKWAMPHSDGSGGTALTLYDFNLDGVVELVYRDETHIQIFDGSGSAPVLRYSELCGSETGAETPIIADVTGDGSADIIVTGHPVNGRSSIGEVMVFEGGESKWASSPSVWNQQLYSPLLINRDLSIRSNIESVNLTYTLPDNSTRQYYNGGPIQAPYISSSTYLPIDLSPDVYVVDGSITYVNANTVTLTVTFGNMGLAKAPAGTPIRYYRNVIGAGNVIGTETLGVDLAPGQTHTITKTLANLSPMPTQFYVRILDDGVNFPAAGSFSDCNLTNNTKSFGTLELHKTANLTSSCIDGTSIFYVELVNNSDQTTSPQTFTNIVLTDSLGTGWQYISSSAQQGTLGAYNAGTRKMSWSISALAPGDTARMTLSAKSTAAGAIRNYIWIEEVGGNILGREVIEAYVIVNTVQAPTAATISPLNPEICSDDPQSSVTLTATASGAASYQWYRNDVEITGATGSTYDATSAGNYTVTYYNGVCVSAMSLAKTVTAKACAYEVIVNPHLQTRVAN